MLYGVILLGLFNLLRGNEFTVEWTAPYLGGMLWLALVSSVLAFTAYLALLGRIGSGRAGYATVLFPVGALLISTVVENYQWSVLAVIGISFVLLGNVIMIRSR
jgi:drug/metabolite transporter (DMT)-like permease